MANPVPGDMELKEACDKRQFVELLRQWLQHIEQNRDFEVQVKGRSCRIPADALERGHFRVEYEIDQGEYEFELTLKWRPA
jgi:amphi-Trp domain-containing protein